ncbi:hypothetical protein [Rhodococcus sp. 077-4]|uniref:hypothetical protein n=1 Tax=Rhodococcus sp. 077-4 TaxID=2789271 RepID=UPI0039F5B9CB
MTYNVSVVIAAGCVVLAIVVLIGAGTARPVQAVSYSSDGRTWTPSLAEPLMDSNIRWVPGTVGYRSSTSTTAPTQTAACK